MTCYNLQDKNTGISKKTLLRMTENFGYLFHHNLLTLNFKTSHYLPFTSY